MTERELRELVKKYPEIAAKVPYADKCPSVTTGSSIFEWYPPSIVAIALRLLWKIETPEVPYQEFLSRYGLINARY